jgi:diguanylate cyclase (GGDEF)-like protein
MAGVEIQFISVYRGLCVKIVIAEDQPVAALFLTRTLERMGHEVTLARDGEEAWEIVRDGSSALLISDWVMPRLDGPSLCRRIRESKLPRYTYIILLTSRDSRIDRLEGLRAGADDFLTKPPDADELAIRLEIANRILSVHETLAERNSQLAELASVDELTGTKNRRRLRGDLESYTADAVGTGLPLSVVMLDIDHFKSYNDTYGHPAGDDVLRTIGKILARVVRRNDVVARYGGEEFAILLPTAGVDEAMEVAKRIRSAIAEWPWENRAITASLGVATLGAVTAPEMLVESADRALYHSKQAGRNRVTHYHTLTAAS